MNLPELLEQAGEIQNIFHVLKNYQGPDPEILQAKEQYVTMFLESMVDGLARPLFNRQPSRRFKATPIAISSLEEQAEEPEEEEEDEGTTNEEKENSASRD
jgi:hypothetical protein